MRIQTNITAKNLSNQMRLNNNQNATASKRLSSGYRVNGAADDAAGVAISEKMRRLIRGLGQAADNIKDGISYLNVGEGAMNEMQNMMQRMRELSLKSLNGTYTDQDRAYMEAEFDELQSQIDQICNGTTFNDMNVFEEHADTYYSIEGNVLFKEEQKHLITSKAPANTLSVVIDPDTYDITVPEGIYTTQELLDELDNVIRRQYPDLDLYITMKDPGYIDVNLENGDKIDSIGGGLAYLIYGAVPQKTEGLLIGVSDFSSGASLDILPGKNDVLTFYVGNSNTPVSVTIPPKSYTREELVTELNRLLAGTDVEAQKYGDGFISLFCPDKVITGLAGNMIQCDGITSILYDISTYGYIDNTAGYVEGAVALDDTINGFRTAGVTVKSGVNDILKFQLDGKTGTTYSINLLTGKVSTDGTTWETYGTAAEYTGEKKFDSLQAIIDRINEICDAKDANGDKKSVGLQAGSFNSHKNIISYYASTGKYNDYLKLYSANPGKDSEVKMIVDATSEALYKNLFTEIEYGAKAKYTAGSNTNIYGNALLNVTTNAPVVIDDSNNAFTIRQTWKTATGEQSADFTLKLTNGKYTSIFELQKEIDNQIKKANAIKDPTNPEKYLRLTCGTFSDSDGTKLSLSATDGNVSKIEFPKLDTEKGTHQLWRGEQPTNTYPYVAGSGNEGNVGSYKPAVYNGGAILSNPVVVDFTNNYLKMDVNEYWHHVYLPQGSYTPIQFVTMMQKAWKDSGYGTELIFGLSADNQVTMTTERKGQEAKISQVTGTAMEFINGETKNANPVSSSGNVNSLEGQKISTLPIVIDDGNKTFTFYQNSYSKTDPTKIETKKYTIEVAKGSYDTQEKLAEAVNDAFKTAVVNGNVAVKEDISSFYKASVNGIAGITITAPGGGGVSDGTNSYRPFDVKTDAGGFYDKILCQTVNDKVTDKYTGYPTDWQSKGSYGANPAYIVGRLDIKNKPVEIKKNANDKLVFNFTAAGKQYEIDIEIKPGTYDNKALIKELQGKVNEKLLDLKLITKIPIDDPKTPEDESIRDSLIRVGIDAVATEGVPDTIGTGAISNKTQLYFYMNAGSSVANKGILDTGDYILDAVRGTAAYSLFYKSEGDPTPVFVEGSVDLSGGVEITAGNNEFIMNIDGKPVRFLLPEGNYTKDELLDIFNQKIKDLSLPIKAAIKNGHLCFEHIDTNAQHTIDQISGSAKWLFYQESGRIDDLQVDFQIGAEVEDKHRFKKSNLSTTLMGINSITVSQQKYALKAVYRLDRAMKYLSEERTRFGVTVNRLDHSVLGNEVTKENLTAAESQIRDADFAKESIKLAQTSLLAKAQESMMAQAKNMNQGVVRLLKGE